MKDERLISPIAYIKTDFKEKFGVPRQSGRVKSLIGEIVFLPKYSIDAAFRGIEKFSHLWIIFDFSLSHREKFSPTVRPPRLGGNTRVGVFASRSPFRPNSLGLSCVEFLGICKKDGNTVIKVGGADLVDGTPIYDIKPYIPYTDIRENSKGSYSDVYASHRLDLVFPEQLLSLVPQDKREALCDILKDDPRPSYKEDGGEIYTMNFARFDVSFRVENSIVSVVEIKKT